MALQALTPEHSLCVAWLALMGNLVVCQGKTSGKRRDRFAEAEIAKLGHSS